MMPIVQVLAFANIETVVVAFLQGRSELTGIPVGARLPTDYDGTSAAVTVTRVGGEFSADDFIDRALVRVDAYGPDKASALNLTGTVRSLIWRLPEFINSSESIITEVGEYRGPSWLRDPQFAAANRYTTRYQLFLRVTPQPD